MMAATDISFDPERELSLTRLIDAPRASIYRCWTEPSLLKRWFAPKPFVTPFAELDVRAGGYSTITMRSPDGAECPANGVYLEVVPNQRLVSTDAFTRAWEPSAKPFLTIIIDLADEAGKTRYTARARHWSIEDRKEHEKMGFHEGWGICTDQLAALAVTV